MKKNYTKVLVLYFLMAAFVSCNKHKRTGNPEAAPVTRIDSAKLEELVLKASNLMFINPDSALVSIRAIRALAEKRHDDRGMMTYYSLSAFLNSCATINYPKAEQFADSAVALAAGAHSEALSFMAAYCKGIAYLGNSDRVDSAIYYHLRARIIYEQDTTIMPRLGTIASLYGNIGILLVKQRNYREAAPYLKKALSLKLKRNDTVGALPCISMLATIEENTNNMTQAYQYLVLMKKLSTIKKDSFNLNISNQDLGKFYYLQHQYDSAQYYLKTALAFAEANGYPFRSSEYHTYLAKTYFHKRDYKHASYWLLKGRATINPLEEEPNTRNLYFETLAELQEKKGNVPEAYDALKQAYAFHVLDASRDKNTTILNYEKNARALKAQFEEERQQQEVLKQKSITLVTLIFGILFAIIIVLVIHSFYRKKSLRLKTANILLEQKAFFNQLNPHFIFNTLAPLQNKILKGEEKEALEYLADFGKLMRDLLQKQRCGYVTLAFEIAFLNNYLTLQQQRVEGAFKYEVTIAEHLPTETLWMPAMFIQPIVENAVKHGITGFANGHISIHFSKQDDYLNIKISDNGRGFQEPDYIKNNHALQMLQERITMYRKQYKDCDFYISSNKTGKGTDISIKLPYFTSPPDIQYT